MVSGGMRGCWGMCSCRRREACVVVGGMHGCWGACMVARGQAWLPGGMRGYLGGMNGCQVGVRGWGWHVWSPDGARCVGCDEIWSISGWYASYWIAFLFQFISYPMKVFTSRLNLYFAQNQLITTPYSNISTEHFHTDMRTLWFLRNLIYQGHGRTAG